MARKLILGTAFGALMAASPAQALDLSAMTEAEKADEDAKVASAVAATLADIEARGDTAVRELANNFEGGIILDGFHEAEEGDVFEAYEIRTD